MRRRTFRVVRNLCRMGRTAKQAVMLLADIVATDENPIKNIKTMESVTFVMKDGVVYKQQ